ncbi:MAG TPA: pirin family protein [Alphaproteobacteria bacterium]
MIKIHDRDLRGRTKTGWLDSWHTYSFAGFRDPERVHFRTLRVLNDDIVIPGAGFPMHEHDNMEIVTYVMSGALEHKDSLGNGGIIRPGELQRMSAGTGIAHSEFNPSQDEPVHLLQLWFFPEKKNQKPSYEQVSIPAPADDDHFVMIADQHGTAGIATIHQDIKILRGTFKEGESATYTMGQDRGVFLQVTKGALTLNGEPLKQGDGAEIEGISGFELKADHDSEVLLFDMD